MFHSIVRTFLWYNCTIILYNRFNTTSSNNMVFPSACLCNFIYTLFYKNQEIEVRLSVLIFQRWSSIKSFLFCSYLKYALSALAAVCAMCSITFMRSLLLSATVAKTCNKHANFHAVLFCNLWIKMLYIVFSKVDKALFKVIATAIKRCPLKQMFLTSTQSEGRREQVKFWCKNAS